MFRAFTLQNPIRKVSHIQLRGLCSASKKHIGVVGTGNVGFNVASSLEQAGHTVTAFDLNKTNYDRLQKTKVILASSVDDVPKNADVLITALPKPMHVKAVMEEGKLLHRLRPNSIWIDHTTTDYNQTIRLCKLACDMGIRAIEAPLTGGMALLRKNMMTVFVGGDEDAVQESKPLIDVYTGTFLYFGAAGKATIAKVISNMLAGAHLIAAGEALMLAKKSGLDMESFFDGIRLSAGNSYVFETEVPLMFKGTYDPDFTIDLHCKDLGLGRIISNAHGVPFDKLEMMELTETMYRRAMERYGGHVGSSFPAKMIEDDLKTPQKLENWEKWDYAVERVTGGSFGVVQMKPSKEKHN
ncbi:uncharacterized protein LOC110250796 [Exaiptasia diaphana]|uniref:3-hydroxyisobutyrate dehydrogenase n=1 Tax=Exaiptasia diaphana TaxID=2652724 RepID=A0A913Y1M8_EXADI|nr:uncharacterized protein LOC110250796 [Exaiptasia diaphana]KXJ23312.1 3-hydroxyisobutyrate dehydrogenase, mitochondrial [Exaiptasia diaphana]